jgi:hypothetical protein
VVRGQSADPPAKPKLPSIWGEPRGSFPAGTVVAESVPPQGRVIAASANAPEVIPVRPTPANSSPVNSAPPTLESGDTAWPPFCRELCAPLHRLGSRVGCLGDRIGCWWNSGCCDDGCSQANCFYANAEYLLWWVKAAPVPPLVTVGGVNDALPGALGQPGTAVLIGGRSLDTDPLSGGRFTFGIWCDDCHDLGFEGVFFFLGQQTTHETVASNGIPVLARPFFNASTGMEDSELIAFPNVLSGGAIVTQMTRLLGAEANLRSNLCRGCCTNVDFLAGFRFIALDEDLGINEALATPTGGSFLVADGFNTRNRFYGGQVGLDAEVRRGHWFLDVKTKIALGSNNEVVNIGGNTVITDPVRGQSALSGGLLALSSNSGRFSREMFAVAPEATVNIGYQLTSNLRAYVGYNFLYLSNVVRPGDQIDRTINPNLIPPPMPSLPVRPAFVFKGSDFWAQGLTFGLEFRY